MAGSGTIYLITAYRHNHLERGIPIDPRFLGSPRNFVLYLVDREGAVNDVNRPLVAEMAINPGIQEAGARHFAEWSFLLSEYDRKFASYPFYMISTRFYEKNARLRPSLDDVWDDAFRLLAEYGFGYLPSYNRDFGFIDYEDYYRKSLLAITLEAVDLINSIFSVDFMAECRLFSDFFCNYIGFNTRRQLEDYVEFYLPLIRHFFDRDNRDVRPVADYTQRLSDVQRGAFRAEKPFSLLLEFASHLYFHQTGRKFAGLSYDGFYEVDERLATGRLLKLLGAADARR